jgi:2-isopropylmalate synthase
MEDFVRIFDTTLRDGEQSPGATMTQDEKLRIARKLDSMKVDVIEAGFPAASPGEQQSVREVASIVEYSEVAGLCRTRHDDIRAAWEALKDANHPRLHVFIATSDIHMEHKLRMDREMVLDEIRRGVSLASELCDTVEFSAEDATRSDIEFLKEAFATAVECGASVVNIPDTVGYTMPSEYFEIVSQVKEVVGDAIISTHCHNDLGLAVANSLAAISAGARQVECCVNGIGERAGNASLEELVMALRTRKDLTGVETRVDATQLLSASRLVSDTTGLAVQWNKAIVGRNAFAHEAGIHQHGMLKNRETYEIMRPEDVGFSESNLVLGKHSGKHALRARLEELGYSLNPARLGSVFAEFKKLCDRKKDIYDEDLHALVNEEFHSGDKHYVLEKLEFSGTTDNGASATVHVRMGEREVTETAEGDGPVNAAFEAIKRCVDLDEVILDEYRIDAITEGADAQGRVHLLIRSGNYLSRGDSTHTDVVVASARAFVDALNHHVMQERLYQSGELRNAQQVREIGRGV